MSKNALIINDTFFFDRMHDVIKPRGMSEDGPSGAYRDAAPGPFRADTHGAFNETPGPFIMKAITLQRDFSHQGYGFCLRGGVEHGVGHFVSSVDQGSIAENQGVKAGDQILSVEGLPLTTATHKEAVSFIASRNKVGIKYKLLRCKVLWVFSRRQFM